MHDDHELIRSRFASFDDAAPSVPGAISTLFGGPVLGMVDRVRSTISAVLGDDM